MGDGSTQPHEGAPAARHGRALGVLLLTLFLDGIGFGILLPILPLLLTEPSSRLYVLAPDVPVKTGYVLLGCLTAVFPLMQFAAAPILGQWSDHVGRKRVLVLTICSSVLSNALFATGIMLRSVPLLFVARMMDGVSRGNLSVAQAAMADLTPPEQRTRTFGMVGAVFGVSAILGPLIGGKLSDPRIVPWFTAATPFWFGAGLAAVNAAWLMAAFRESLARPSSVGRIRPEQAVANVMAAFAHRGLRAVFATVFLYWVGFTFFTSFFSVFLVARFGYDQGDIGTFYGVLGVCHILAQFAVVRRLANHVPEHQVLRASLVGVASFMALYLLARTPAGIYAVLPFMATCVALTHANLVGLVSRSTPPQHQGRMLGVNASVQALAQTFPPVLSGLLAARIAVHAPIVAGAAFIASAGALFIVARRSSGAARR